MALVVLCCNERTVNSTRHFAFSESVTGMIQNSSDARNSRRRPAPIKTKHDWQERFRNLRIGRRGAEEADKAENPTMAYALFDENICFASEREVKVCKLCHLST